MDESSAHRNVSAYTGQHNTGRHGRSHTTFFQVEFESPEVAEESLALLRGILEILGSICTLRPGILTE
jgi:hypothetical protein